MEKDAKLAEALSQLRRDAELSLARANGALADGLRPLIGTPLGAPDLAAATYNVRWSWQDEVARLMRQYVRQLWRLAKRHQVSSVSTWIGEQQQTFGEVLEGKLREFGFGAVTGTRATPPRLEREQTTQREDGEPVLAKRRPPRLRGELIIFRGDTQLRIPVVVSAQMRFLESLVLRPVRRKLRQRAGAGSRASTPRQSRPWLFQKHRIGWSVGSPERLVEFRDLLGMTYLQTLLRSPEVEIPVEQLVRAARTTTALPVYDPEFDVLGSWEAEYEILDDQAKREYQKRIKQLQRDAEIATELSDTQRMTTITEELEFLRAQLKRATAIRGRPRRFVASGDRQRVSVRKSTAKAIEVISQRIPDIGEHLKASISFGYKCCYRPVQQRDWQF